MEYVVHKTPVDTSRKVGFWLGMLFALLVAQMFAWGPAYLYATGPQDSETGMAIAAFVYQVFTLLGWLLTACVVFVSWMGPLQSDSAAADESN
jgi:hypothetical protein